MNKDFKFEDLYEAIYKILPNEDLQELMDVCYEITGVPILIVDIMYNVYGIAPLHPVGNENRDYLLEHRTYDDERVQLMYNDGFISSVDMNKAPYIIDWGSSEDFPAIQGIVKINNSVEAYVTMHPGKGNITDDLMKAMSIIQNVCGYFLKSNRFESSNIPHFQKVFISELLSGNIKNEKQLNEWFQDMNCEILPPYILTAVTARNFDEKLALSMIRRSCQSLLPNQLILIHDNVLYILHYKASKKGSSLHEYQSSLTKIVKRFHAQAGISQHFSNLLLIEDYKIQTLDAIKYGQILNPDARLYLYQDYILPAILYPRIEQMPVNNYMPKSLENMNAYDMENATEFLPTLKSYIFNLKNTKETASELHIHRNTLLYRINKIEELFGITLDSAEDFLYIMMIFYMQDLKKNL